MVVRTIRDEGILTDASSDEQIVAAGHTACDVEDAGGGYEEKMAAVGEHITETDNLVTLTTAEMYLRSALCPEHAGGF
ncbi:DUF732 domain-containing protein [Georgenia yuyongxinii]|uniref:DUF732 domain-containing protein n=1 Tax=Georgenia yuyongxinii TaxID=2589797 RepID=A0A552WV29_9MICO|nr:DUF732 domain-containing protein [Georgenia yuyongxinii]TRW46419.1 hypothetical protein FJ693_05690 [Georgenia yuyongxinii]